MKPSISFLILSFSFLAMATMAIVGNIPYWAWFIPIGVGIMATMALFQGTFLPQRAVSRGMELIHSQDYNNRLVKVGEPNADKIVSLFNSLIDKLRAERLQNREQESLLSLLIEASPMGVVMLDFDGKITLANKSFLKIFGIKNPEELIGNRINEINNDLVPDIVKVPLGKSEIIRRGNFRIYRVYHLNFIQEGFRREFFLLESMTDEIMKAERSAYEKVIRTISHEVNNSMGGLRSVLEMVIDQTEDEDLKGVAESCHRRCESMGNFIREYAEVVKLPDPVLKSTDINKEIDLFLPFLKNMLPENIELAFTSESGSSIVNADMGQLQQVILNIVKNAAESIAESQREDGNKLKRGLIEIKVTKAEGNILLTISNNGIPIDSNISPQLFTPFFTTKPEGKGIGLTLIREVLSRHSSEYSLLTGSDGITRFNIKFNPL